MNSSPKQRLLLIFLTMLTVIAWVARSVLADATTPSAPPLPQRIEFNRDIRPIFSDVCFHCHGPDEGTRKAGLRLDTPEGAFVDLGGYHAIVAGDLEASALFQRITSKDPSERMPPPESNRHLDASQIELIRRWIEQGADWQTHWSFIAPKRPPLATALLQHEKWGFNPIDAFVLAQLEREGFKPSPEADRETLIRRVTLDLTGLPPTPHEIDAFLNDPSPNAYLRVVDRLLHSSRYGERMAMEWLDAARFADTKGYQTDGNQSMWRWRDWVIDAFNANMPFDQFTVEQLAGDKLPNPTLDQRIATGFNRNHRINSEGGIIAEEFLVEYAVDRVDTTATVWLGLTLSCARCHDHKYDPFTQKDFYQLFAFFDNVPERGRAIKLGNAAPLIKAPTGEMRLQLAKLNSELKTKQQKFESLRGELAASQAEWEAKQRVANVSAASSKEAGVTELVDWTFSDDLAVHHKLDGDTSDATKASDAFEFQDGEAVYGNGRVGRAAVLDGNRFVESKVHASFHRKSKASVAVWFYPEGDGDSVILSMTDDLTRQQGMSIHIRDDKLQFFLGPRWLDDAIRLETKTPLPRNRWHHVLVTYDGTQFARGTRVYLNGKLQDMRILMDEFTGAFEGAKLLIRLGFGTAMPDRFVGRVDDVRYYNRELSMQEVAIVSSSETPAEILGLDSDQRRPGAKQKLRAYFLETYAPESIRKAYWDLKASRRALAEFEKGLPTTMVMQDRPEPRETHILIRGEYDKPGKRVYPEIPSSLPPLPEGLPKNRLGFAQWLVHPTNPLTARVLVNRYWQLFFGVGIVKTVEDFGSQGEWPSHPELLDWLATEFIRLGWDIKAIVRLIVTSATYRQTAAVNKEVLLRDPENRLLSRAPRLRLPAEMIRDQALAVGGLLGAELGGPSVKPYQPAGLWRELAVVSYKQDHGEKLYRRSMYTFWKRTVPPPVMTTFDAGAREICTVQRSRTNTPLQALVLMNEIAFVEAARFLGQRMLTEGGKTPKDRIRAGFRWVLSRWPNQQELDILLSSYQRNIMKYQSDQEAAEALVSFGETASLPELDPGELAAYTTTANLILNLDEAITRE